MLLSVSQSVNTRTRQNINNFQGSRNSPRIYTATLKNQTFLNRNKYYEYNLAGAWKLPSLSITPNNINNRTNHEFMWFNLTQIFDI